MDQDAHDGSADDPKRWHQRAGWRLAIVAVFVVIGLAWHAGSFDHALYNVGLNAKECARNGFGATFCGEELSEYRERLQIGERERKETSAKTEREGREAQATVREQEAKAEREGQAFQRQAKEDEAAAQRAEEQIARNRAGSEP